MPDADAEKVTLEPDSISFMETLIAKERGEAGMQNGFSRSAEEDRSDQEGTSAPPVQICPVGLHKAVLLYPPTAQSLRYNIINTLWWFEFKDRNLGP